LQELGAGKYALFTYSLSPFIFFVAKKRKTRKIGGKERERERERERGLPREQLTTSNARKDKYERRNMNENDLSDLVFKNKKEWGFQNKAHTCKKCTKATPASKKILVNSL